ncbi:hypothetical protein FRC03_004481 [Tulasnella sp. 419]|nr:hypothetical protein FRC02_011770 [Tulasnella sp. 418]KAG8962217.1 hypothetical protein FRC03_004481 [Tulasnella sp. 419]
MSNPPNRTVNPQRGTSGPVSSGKPAREIRNRSLWGSYEALPRRTRLYFGVGIGLVGAVGLYVSDQLEDKYPASNA